MDNGFAEGYAVGQGNSNGAYGMGGYGAWEWIWIIILFALWGNNGWGNNGNGVGAEVQRGFDTQTIVSKLDGLNNGLCDGFYAMNTGMLNGFNATQMAIMQGGYDTRSAISDLGYRLQDCCCTTQRAIDGVNYNMARNTCDITNAINAGFTGLYSYLAQEKISSLQSENATLTAQLSQNSQTNTIINALRPVAQPAYITCSPYESVFGYNRTACGCGG